MHRNNLIIDIQSLDYLFTVIADSYWVEVPILFYCHPVVGTILAETLATVPTVMNSPQHIKVSFAFKTCISQMIWNPKWWFSGLVFSNRRINRFNLGTRFLSSVIED